MEEPIDDLEQYCIEKAVEAWQQPSTENIAMDIRLASVFVSLLKREITKAAKIRQARYIDLTNASSAQCEEFLQVIRQQYQNRKNEPKPIYS